MAAPSQLVAILAVLSGHVSAEVLIFIFTASVEHSSTNVFHLILRLLFVFVVKFFF